MKEELTSTSSAPSMGRTNGKWVSKDASTSSSSSLSSSLSGYSDMFNGALKSVGSASTRAAGMVREYPVQAAVGALALGFVLGAAIRRRPTM